MVPARCAIARKQCDSASPRLAIACYALPASACALDTVLERKSTTSLGMGKFLVSSDVVSLRSGSVFIAQA